MDNSNLDDSVDSVIREWGYWLEENQSVSTEIRSRYLWIIDDQYWLLDFLPDQPSISETNKACRADLEIKVSSENFIKLAQGKLNPQVAHQGGLMLLSGDLGAAIRLNIFFLKAICVK